MPVTAGTVLTCSNTECGCRVEVQEPCPHGDAYTCACGALLSASDGDPVPPTPGA